MIHNSPYSLMRYFFRQSKCVVVESSSYFARWISFCYELVNWHRALPYRDILVYYNYIYIIFIYKIIPRIGPSIGMLGSAFEIRLSLPKINPAPLTNPEPPFLDTIRPLHRLIQTPSMVLGKDLFRKVPSCSIFLLF